MPRIDRRLSDWKVTIDGVEVPHLGFNISCGRNMVATGQLFLEPDSVVHKLRPNSLIHFWFYDETEESSAIEDRYKLYMEVELTGPTHSKTPQSRSMGVSFAGLFRIFARHKLFMSSVGHEFQTTHITGGYAIPEMAASVDAASPDPFSVLALAGLFDTNNKPNNGDVSPYRTSKKGDFAERLIPFLTYLCSFNASQRLSAVRTRLMNKIAAVPDQTLGGLIPATLSNAVFQQLQGDVTAGESYLDLIGRFCGQAFYSWYQMPAPFFGEPGSQLEVPDSETGKIVSMSAQPSGGADIIKPPIFKDKDLGQFSMVRDYNRNDYLFAPELFYAAPPPCNFIMPEDITQLSYQRIFDNEPTRVIITEPYLTENKAAYFSPVTLLRSMKKSDRLKVSSAEFFATNIEGLSGASSAGGSTSPYMAPAHTARSQLGRGVNLLSVLSEDEIEKGILCSREVNAFELFTAIAREFETGKADAEGLFDQAAQRAERINRGESSKYEKIMTTIADYRYQLMKAERLASVSCRGLRWAVPGFSAIIFDKDSSYLCFIDALTFSVDSSTGAETTSLQLSKVRTIPSVSKQEAVQLEKHFESDRQIRSAKYSAIIDRYNKKIADLDAAIAQLDRSVTKAKRYVDILDPGHTRPMPLSETGPLSSMTNRLRETGSTTLSDVTLQSMRAAADRLDEYAASVKMSLFPPSTEAARRFVSQNGVPPNPARLAGDINKRVVAQFDENSSFGVGVKISRAFRVPYTQRERYERGDYARYGAEYLPAFLDGQLGSDVFVVSKDPKATEITRKILDTVQAQGKTLAKQIRDYLSFQMTLVQSAVDSKTKADVDTFGDPTIAAAVDASETPEDYIRSFFSDLTGFFMPPTWFNRGFMAASTLDKTYQSVLGCRPFYGKETEFGRGLDGVAPGQEMTPKTVYDESINLLRMLDRLFPIVDPAGGITTSRLGSSNDNPSGVTKWEELTNQPDLSAGPGPWVEKNLKRRQVMSLKWFLKMHGLKLTTQISDAPVREEFWVMVPVNAKDENTIFDFLVDEWEKFPSLSVAVAASSSIDAISRGTAPMIRHGGDPLIKEIRQQLREAIKGGTAHPSAQFLFREARQELIIDYARRHFGSRAFDGR